MDSLIEQIAKSKNDKHLYKFLYKIRTQYIKNESDVEKFSKKGIKTLSLLLGRRIELETSQENDKIIEILLSILGNCTCNNKNSSLEAFESSICENVIAIVNKSDKSEMRAKGCRLLGNLAQTEKIALSLQQLNAALCLSNCLSEDANPQLLTMTVRAIRLMWNSKKFRFQLLSFGTLYKIMHALSKALKNEASDDEEEESSVKDLNMVILKRKSEPDRLVSKEKLNNIIEKMENNDVEINYEIFKPEKRKRDEFMIPKTKENFELVSGILKCLLTITTATSLPQIVKSIFADGIGIPCLLFLADEKSKFRSIILKILSNLSYNSFSQEFLGINNELIPTICNLLLNSSSFEKPLDENEQKYCLNILCLSSENACNRLKLRRSGVFKILLSIANTTKNQNELNIIIFAFYQFRFDEDGLNCLIQLNLINVLIKILSDIVEDKEVDHIQMDDPSLDEERKEELKAKFQNQKKRLNSDPLPYNNFNKYMRLDSTSPSSSGYASNPQASPTRSSSGYSPLNSPVRCYKDYDSDSNQYSPVCSDKEEEEGEVKKDFDILAYIYTNDEIGRKEEIIECDDDESNLTINDNASDDEESKIEKSDAQTGAKKLENIPEMLKLIEADQMQYILLLLWKVSIKHSDASAFVRPTNLMTLIKAAKILPRPNGKIYQIIQNILEQMRNFVPIFLRQDFIFEIFKLSKLNYDHENCYSCSKMKFISSQLLKDLGKVAESGYGQGEIIHCLLSNDDELKRKMSVKLLYVISSVELLNQFLYEYRALDIIMDIIFNEMDLAEWACDGITIMANNLNLTEYDVLQRIIPDDFVEDENLIHSNGELVKFIVKDGEVSFDKEMLKNSSDVFNSMLSSGAFRESNFNEVRFPNYTKLGMKYFFQLINMHHDGKLKTIAPKINNVNAVMQAYELSILYIMTEIQQPILNVIKIILDETKVLEIFEWSIKNRNHDLLISTICYFLCADIDGKTKLKMYLDANKSQFKNEWKTLILDCILMKCKPTDD